MIMRKITCIVCEENYLDNEIDFIIDLGNVCKNCQKDHEIENNDGDTYAFVYQDR